MGRTKRSLIVIALTLGNKRLLFEKNVKIITNHDILQVNPYTQFPVLKVSCKHDSENMGGRE